MRPLGVVLVGILLVTACGDGDSYANPTAGPLPTYDSVEAVTEALSSDCEWQISVPQEETDETEAYCEVEDLWAQWMPGDYIQTVDEVRKQVEDLSDENVEELCEHFGGAPFVYGGNWWVVARDDAQGAEVARAPGGYLRPAVSCDSDAPAS